MQDMFLRLAKLVAVDSLLRPNSTDTADTSRTHFSTSPSSVSLRVLCGDISL